MQRGYVPNDLFTTPSFAVGVENANSTSQYEGVSKSHNASPSGERNHSPSGFDSESRYRLEESQSQYLHGSSAVHGRNNPDSRHFHFSQNEFEVDPQLLGHHSPKSQFLFNESYEANLTGFATPVSSEGYVPVDSVAQPNFPFHGLNYPYSSGPERPSRTRSWADLDMAAYGDFSRSSSTDMTAFPNNFSTTSSWTSNYVEKDVMSQKMHPLGRRVHPYDAEISASTSEPELPKEVDGITVNPEWGLTKAGKARQRLPVACLTCRTKKIKCLINKDGGPCLNCLKSASLKNTCRVETSQKPRKSKGQRRASTNPGSEGSNKPGRRKKTPSGEPISGRPQQLLSADERESSISRKSSMDIQSRISGGSKAASGHSYMTESDVGTYPRHSMHGGGNPLIFDIESFRAFRDRSKPGFGIQHSLSESPRHNALPNQPVIEHLCNLFFKHLHSQSYSFLHKKTFFAEIEMAPPFLLLSICATSCRFSDELRDSEAAKIIQDHATQLALENFDNLEIETVQGLLLLSLHYDGLGEKEKSWMFGSMAIQMSNALRLNEEDDTLALYSPGAEDNYTRSRTAIKAEIRRRTYWSSFLLDRYRFNCEIYMNPFQVKEDVAMIYLPCSEEFFEHGIPVQTEPLLRTTHIQKANPQLLGTTAHLVRIIRIWGNIASLFFQTRTPDESTHVPPILKLDGSTFTNFVNACNEWYDELPTRYRFSCENLEFQYMEKNSTADTFILMNVAYHTCMVLLHRYVRLTGNEDSSIIIGHIREAYCHAYKIISIVNECEKRKRRLLKAGQSPVMTSSPFLGPAIMIAADVVTRWAAHLPSEMLDKDGYLTNSPSAILLWNAHRGLRIASELLESIGIFWEPIRALHLTLCTQINKIRIALGQISPEDITDQTDIGEFGNCSNFASWKIDSTRLEKIKSSSVCTNLRPVSSLTDLIYSGDFFAKSFGALDTMRLQTIMNDPKFGHFTTAQQYHALENYIRFPSGSVGVDTSRVTGNEHAGGQNTAEASSTEYRTFEGLDAAYGGGDYFGMEAPIEGAFASPFLRMDITMSQLDEMTTSELAGWAPDDLMH